MSRYLPAATRAALQAQVVCQECGDPGNFQRDHRVPVALGGGNEPENLQRLCLKHHKEKTRRDIKMIAKANRLRKGPRQRKGRAIQSPGFDTRWRRKFNGKTEAR